MYLRICFSYFCLLYYLQVEVALAGGDTKKEEDKEEATQLKVLPPWMIMQGMNLTASQRGETIKLEVKTEDGASPNGPDVKDVKPVVEDNEEVQRKIREAYLEAYYAALLQRKQKADALLATAETELESANGNEENDERQVGMKSKRDANDDFEAEEEEEEVEWEDAAAGMMSPERSVWFLTVV